MAGDKVIIHTDGGSRGNPGPAAAGFVLNAMDGSVVKGRGEYLGKATNNEAEYAGFISSLKAAAGLKFSRVLVYSDSELLVKQINGQYRVRSSNIKPLYGRAMELLGRFNSWEVVHVRRERNEQADKLVNDALDCKSDVEMVVKTKPSGRKPIRLGVLLSGGGRTLLNILDYIDTGRLNAEVVVVISSRSNVKAVRRSRTAGIETIIVRKRDYADIDSFSLKLAEELRNGKVDLVIQAGWLCLWKIPSEYENKVMNIHPALLPSFGGEGMWGRHVHDAVLESGCKVSGCTVHFCTNEYDEGPIIIQRCCEVTQDDNAETLAARVFEQESLAYTEAIRLFEQGSLSVSGNKVIVKR